MEVYLILPDGTKVGPTNRLPIELDASLEIGTVALRALTAADIVTVEPGTAPLVVSATALDTRPMTAADVVTVEPGTAPLVVSATALDTRPLTAATDAITVEPGTTPLPTRATATRSAATTYRTGVAAADTMAPATISLANSLTPGSLTAAEHTAVVAAINATGTSGPSAEATLTPPAAGAAADLTIGQVAGATAYRIYFCLCPTDPHYLITITEAERASGGTVSVVEGTPTFTPADPATPGIITILEFGGGEITVADLSTTTPAYVLPAADPVVCTGYPWAIATVVLTPTWAGPITAKVLAFRQNGNGTWSHGPVIDLMTSGAGLCQELPPIPVNGAAGFALLFAELANCTATVDVERA